MDIYVKFHEEAEKDDSLNDEARAWFLKMEQGNEEALEIWQWFRDISLIPLPVKVFIATRQPMLSSA